MRINRKLAREIFEKNKGNRDLLENRTELCIYVKTVYGFEISVPQGERLLTLVERIAEREDES